MGKGDEETLLRKEFEISLQRDVFHRVERGFIKTFKPVMDETPYRIFNTIEHYREWCQEKLPRWLGYGKAS